MTDSYTLGFTSNYIHVKVLKSLKRNTFYIIKAIAIEHNYLIGEVVEEKVEVC